MKRAEFQQRSILLRSDRQLIALIALLPNLPLDDKHPLEVLIREPVKLRTISQNNLYWLRLGEIAEQGWLFHRQYEADIWHIYCGRTVMPERVTLKDGTVVSKWVETPDSVPQVISTTRLEKKCFADYITAVEAFGAALGVMFSASPR